MVALVNTVRYLVGLCFFSGRGFGCSQAFDSGGASPGPSSTSMLGTPNLLSYLVFR